MNITNIQKELSVFHHMFYSWNKIFNWFKNIKPLLCSIKCAWSRATKGYCTHDVWATYKHISALLICELNELLQKSPIISSLPVGERDQVLKQTRDYLYNGYVDLSNRDNFNEVINYFLLDNGLRMDLQSAWNTYLVDQVFVKTVKKWQQEQTRLGLQNVCRYFYELWY